MGKGLVRLGFIVTDLGFQQSASKTVRTDAKGSLVIVGPAVFFHPFEVRCLLPGRYFRRVSIANFPACGEFCAPDMAAPSHQPAAKTSPPGTRPKTLPLKLSHLHIPADPGIALPQRCGG